MGLRTTIKPEHTLAPAAAQAQRQALRSVQDGVTARVIGATQAKVASVHHYDFIPYSSMFVDSTQLSRLLADPQVVSVQEDVPKAPLLQDSTKIIHATNMWAATPTSYTGAGWAVAVLDTGVDKTHPMLTRVKSEACYSTNSSGVAASSVCPGGVTDSTAAGSGKNCSLAVRGCDHGTHVASIAAGFVDNSATGGVSLSGVAKSAKIIAIQVFTRFDNSSYCGSTQPCALTYDSDWLKGLQRVYELRTSFKIASVNMSLGGGQYTASCDSNLPAQAAAVAQLKSVGIATVIAAGNNGYDGSISSPACLSEAVSVGATTKTDEVASYSNHSALVKVMAPGSDIYAAVPGNKYATKSGTSMATPHVVGAFALLRQAQPSLTVNDFVASLACSGKHVQRNGLDKPRIDVFSAYKDRAPAGTMRQWTFAGAGNGRDWAPLRGNWIVDTAAGFYRLNPVTAGFNSTSVPNCESSFDLTAQTKRVDPDGNWANGFFIKATLDYQTRNLTGYWLAYSNDGGASVWRLDGVNVDTISGSATALCPWSNQGITVNRNAKNTLRAVVNGSTIQYYVNGKLFCTATDGTYATGQMIANAYIPSTTTGHSFAIDLVSIKSLQDTSTLAASSQVIDPAAYAPKAAPAKGSIISSSPAGAPLTQ